MGNAVILYLKYLGRDSWDRPVYEDGDGVIWKDVNPRAVESYSTRFRVS